jgi:hypothetical protein
MVYPPIPGRPQRPTRSAAGTPAEFAFIVEVELGAVRPIHRPAPAELRADRHPALVDVCAIRMRSASCRSGTAAEYGTHRSRPASRSCATAGLATRENRLDSRDHPYGPLAVESLKLPSVCPGRSSKALYGTAVIGVSAGSPSRVSSSMTPSLSSTVELLSRMSVIS